MLHKSCDTPITSPCSQHTHTHTNEHTHGPYHANIVIPARNFLPLLAVTCDLTVLWWWHNKILHWLREVQIVWWHSVCVWVYVSLSALTVSVFADRTQAWLASFNRGLFGRVSRAVCLFWIIVDTRLLPLWHQSNIKESWLWKTSLMPSLCLTGFSLDPAGFLWVQQSYTWVTLDEGPANQSEWVGIFLSSQRFGEK